MTEPTLFNQPSNKNGAKDGFLDDLGHRKEALRKKFRQAFVTAVALPVAALSAHNLIKNKDPETNLEKPGLVLTIKEVVDYKILERQEKQESSQQRLDAIYSKVSQTEMGRDILRFIKDNRVKVDFYDMSKKEYQDIAKDGTLGTYSSANNEIKLNPAVPDDEIMTILAHETRHAWQNHKINYKKIELSTETPEKKILIQRYTEADAFAYQTAFALDYESKTGKRLILGRSLKADEKFYTTDAEMREQLRKDMIDGLNPKQARLNVLKLGFETLKDRGYDRGDIENLHKDVNSVFTMISSNNPDTSESMKQYVAHDVLQKHYNDPDWKTMIGHLRKFGNMGLRSGDANYLDGVSDKNIASLEWMGGLSDVRAPQFKEIKSKYIQTIAQSEKILSEKQQDDETREAQMAAKPAKVIKIPGTNFTL